MLKPARLMSGAAILLLGVACAAPQLTPDQVMALRQAQSRAFEVPVDTVFKSTMTYLQDNHYQIKQASRDSGMINATKATDLGGGAKFLGNLLIGAAAKKGDSYDVTFTFEAIDAGNTKVRCNITHGVNNQAGVMSDVQAVTDPAAYKGILDALATEVQRKHMTDAMRQAKDTGK